MRFLAWRLPSGCVNCRADVPAVPLPRVEGVEVLVEFLAHAVDPQAGLQVQRGEGLVLVEMQGDALVLQHQLRLRQVEAVLEGLANLLVLVDVPRIVRRRVDGRQHDVGQLAEQADVHDALEAVLRGVQRVFGDEDALFDPRDFGLGLQDLDGRQGADRHLLADLFEELLGEGALAPPHLQVLDAKHQVPVKRAGPAR